MVPPKIGQIKNRSVYSLKWHVINKTFHLVSNYLWKQITDDVESGFCDSL